ncbi:hypothetical protein [Actinoplanes sp. GCM10030250]|uniref:hypothetical protein n=1 Tax=Actinoplanes sp. GCM10030250 TaxID=3273376 RepID=UPI003622A418
MTGPGRIAYFVVLVLIAVLGFSVRVDLWLSVTVAAVAMVSVSLFETLLSRRRDDHAGTPSSS